MQITPFDFSGKTVRIMMDDKGDPWWIALDICRILGLQPKNSVRYLDVDEKSYASRKHLGLNPGKDIIIINEYGLYSLILKSRKPKAIKFKRWITHDILPLLRKTGSYSVEKIELPTTKLGWMKLAVETEEKNEKLLIENKMLLPKAKALDEITDTTSLKNLTESAKVMSVKPRELIRRLEISKILYRKRNRQKTLLPYQYYIDNGWFEVKMVGPGDEKKYTQTLLTPRGIAKLRVRYNLQ